MEKNKALVVIDIQNDITKNYKEIIDNINKAIEKANKRNIPIVYIKNIFLDTKYGNAFQEGTFGVEFCSDLKILSNNIFIKHDGSAYTSKEFVDFLEKNKIKDLIIIGADAFYCVKFTCEDLCKNNYNVTVISDCITSFDKTKIPELLKYYASKGAKINTLEKVL